MIVDKKNTLELSRPLELHELDEGAVERAIIADAAERTALASRFDLLELKCLRARLDATRVPDSPLVYITGSLHAEAVQRCVVTLEPLAACIDEKIDALYGPEDARTEIVDTQVEEATLPEPFDGEMIDVGELIAQQMALALDPYPRKSDADATEYASERLSGADSAESGPFSELAKWRKEGP